MRYILSLEDILDYFLNRNIDAGERFTREFNKKCQNIAKFPNIGRSYANVDPSLRAIPVDGYIIFYHKSKGLRPLPLQVASFSVGV